MSENLKPGDRVRLNERGRQIMRQTPPREGVIQRLSQAGRADVSWEGRTSTQDLSVQYLERAL